jgi:hypothetical protein
MSSFIFDSARYPQALVHFPIKSNMPQHYSLCYYTSLLLISLVIKNPWVIV